MKKLLLSVAVLIGATSVNAQLPNGSVAPDFTVTDINGGSHNLYSYLDLGYTVIIDLNATWCGPCWNYHLGGALETVWTDHGPAGGNGVSAGTTDDVIVFMIESDNATTLADLNGTGGNTTGDWVTGTPFFIVDDASVGSAYNLAYYPTIYTICPNRILTESGQISAAAHYTVAGNCASATGTTNGALLGYTGETITCGAPIAMSVDLQNMGNGPLTAATIEVFDGATSVLSYNWAGNLSTYQIASVNIGSVSPATTTNYSIQITSTDDDLSDNTLMQTVNAATQVGASITVELLTDSYPDETYMEITNGVGTVIWSEGNESVAGNFDTGSAPAPADPTSPLAANTTYTWPVALPATDCYNFTIYDYYGDGLGAAQWGGTDGDYSILDGATVVISASVADFGGSEEGVMKRVAGLNEMDVDNVTIYPNPANEVLNVSFNANDADYTISITDLQGRTIATELYSNISGAQTVNFNVADFATGSYIVTIYSEVGTHTENVVIK